MIRVCDAFDPATHKALDQFIERPDGVGGVELAQVIVPLTPAELAAVAEADRKRYAAVVQRHLDAAVQARGYDSIHTCASYADEPAVPQFQAEGRAARAWRSAVWARCYEVLAEVEAGVRTAPSEADLVALLPALTWPS